MSVTKVDLLNKRFSKSMFGYSRMEVDQFMLEVADTVGALVDKQKGLKKKIAELEASVEEYKLRDETLRDTLMSTQKMVDDIKSNAGKEAEVILAEAQTRADSIVQRGHNRLAQVHTELETLKMQRTEFKIQLQALLEGYLRMLEQDDPEVEKMEKLESKLKFLKKAE